MLFFKTPRPYTLNGDLKGIVVTELSLETGQEERSEFL